MNNPNTGWDTSWAWFMMVAGYNQRPSPGTQFIITESGDPIITENGLNIVTEQS